MKAPRFWSWVDLVRHFNLYNFAYSLHRMTTFIWLAKECHKPDDLVHESIVDEMKELIEQLRMETEQLHFDAAHVRAKKHLRWALRAYGQPTWGRMGQEFETFWEVLEPELPERRFVSIDTRRNDLLSDLIGEAHGLKTFGEHEKPNQVWPRIFEQFPSAKDECGEAVYCYALERNTACVFHSMRVAELGLRALARRLKVRLPKGKPLEWGEWSQLIKAMQGKTDHVATHKKPGRAKDEVLDFYHGCIGQFLGFKDEFRNQVMHVRKAYDSGQAESALTRVRDFMAKLASRIDEKGRVVREQK